MSFKEYQAQEKVRAMLKDLDLETLLKTFRNMAKRYTDGHYTILAFTTGFKATFGTIGLDDFDVRVAFSQVKNRDNLKDAIIDALVEKRGIAGELRPKVKIVGQR